MEFIFFNDMASTRDGNATNDDDGRRLFSGGHHRYSMPIFDVTKMILPRWTWRYLVWRLGTWARTFKVQMSFMTRFEYDT